MLVVWRELESCFAARMAAEAALLFVARPGLRNDEPSTQPLPTQGKADGVKTEELPVYWSYSNNCTWYCTSPVQVGVLNSMNYDTHILEGARSSLEGGGGRAARGYAVRPR